MEEMTDYISYNDDQKNNQYVTNSKYRTVLSFTSVNFPFLK